MISGDGSARQLTGPATTPLGSDAFLPGDAVAAVRSHPRFRDAVRHVLDGATALYDGNRLLNRVANDRGRLIGGMIALYLHVCSMSDEGEPGFTVHRFQAFCVERKLCSFGRARALLALMRFAGYLAPAPSGSDRRKRRLVPTAHLIELQRRRWQYQFEAMALVSHEGSRTLALCDRPDFLRAFLRHLGARYIAGFRLLDCAPELSRLVESNAGLLMVLSLFLAAADGMTPDGGAVPLSISALSARLGVARAHVRKLLVEAGAAGLVRRTGASATVIVLPRCIHAVSNFLASLLALIACCANDAAEEIARGDATAATVRTYPRFFPGAASSDSQIQPVLLSSVATPFKDAGGHQPMNPGRLTKRRSAI